MKASELRIGNLLMSNRGVIVVCAIETGFNEFTNGENSINDFPISELSPIPMTEEWLVKFGFEKKWDEDGSGDYDLIIQDGRYRFILRTEVDGWLVLHQRDIGLNYELLSYLNYVHELQNLYFCLTGNELTIK